MLRKEGGERPMGVVEDLARARDAYERREWLTVYDALSELDRAALDPDDFARLSMTAFLLGRTNDGIQSMQRAYQAHHEAGEPVAAARCAGWLAMMLFSSGETAVANGWVGRCQRLLDEIEEDVVERGYLLIHLMFRDVLAGRFEAAFAIAGQIIEYAHRFDDPSLLAEGLMAQGRMLLYAGQVPRGLALLDEAMIGVTAGTVSPLIAGEVYCSLVEACREVSDYGRAAEWTSALAAWIDAQPGLVRFTGQCAVHRGQLLRIRGEYGLAIEEFETATTRYLDAGTPAQAGIAMDECGAVFAILGDFEAAEACYQRAASFGHEPQPGLTLLWLARGRSAAALAAVRRLLAEPRDPVHRSQILPAAAEVLAAVGESVEATAAAEELVRIAEAFGCSALHALATAALGHARLASDDAAAAIASLRQAIQAWQRLDAPYEVARCQLLMGRALRSLGDEESATGELLAARRTFGRLGAAPAEREAARLLTRGQPWGLTEREVEVLRLVASGRSNPEIASALILSEKTVARHLSNIFTKLNVGTRTAAAAFAYEHHLL